MFPDASLNVQSMGLWLSCEACLCRAVKPIRAVLLSLSVPCCEACLCCALQSLPLPCCEACLCCAVKAVCAVL